MAVECISSATTPVIASRTVGPCVPSRDVTHSPRHAKLKYLDLLPTVDNRWQWNAYLLLQSQLTLLGQLARAFLHGMSHSPRQAKRNYLDLLPTADNRWQWNAYLLLQRQLSLLGQLARAFLLGM